MYDDVDGYSEKSKTDCYQKRVKAAVHCIAELVERPFLDSLQSACNTARRVHLI